MPEWDDGRIAVGNGESESHWVHDDLRVTAMAIEDPRSADIVVVVATDLYMIFRNDAEGIRAKAAALVPRATRARRRSSSASTHNHHGPDTAFDVNHAWYEQMTTRRRRRSPSAVAGPSNRRASAGGSGRALVRHERRHGSADLSTRDCKVLQATNRRAG